VGTPEHWLAGQVAVVSGGLGDIGRAVAERLARAGADVAVGDRVDGPAPAGARNVHRVDVADPASVRAWLDAVEAELGLPTVVVPNAAVVQPARLLDGGDAWERTLAVNLTGAQLVATDAARRLVAAGRPGRIVFLGSWAAEAVHAEIPAYCVAKAGLRMLSRCLAYELAPHGITVNEVAPGFVDAGLGASLYARDPALRTADEAVVPAGRLATVEDVAAAVAHLCHPDAAYVTGTVALVDGGLSLVSPGTAS
jgi:glucose 1-dehydrogenase